MRLYKEALDKYPAAGILGSRLHRQQQRHAATEEVAPRREEGEADPQGLRQGSASCPKILIVTEKLLTGFDAPILYAMYLDKPMRDHTLLQAIARVNRPYENEAAGDGQAARLRARLRRHLRQAGEGAGVRQRRDQRDRQGPRAAEGALQDQDGEQGAGYLELVDAGFNDKDVDNLIEHFRDKDRRKEFFKEYKEIEMLYEIISPDAFLRPYIDDYTSLSSIYAVVRKAYAKTVYVDRAFQRKTNELVQKHVDVEPHRSRHRLRRDRRRHDRPDQAEARRRRHEGHQPDQEHREDGGGGIAATRSWSRWPSARKAVQESFEDRQTSTAEALEELFAEIERNERAQEGAGREGARWLDATSSSAS